MALGSSLLLLALAGCTTDDPADSGPSPADGGSTGAESSATSASPDEPEEPSASERLGLLTGWGPTREEMDEAAELVADLSLEELAGQTIVARYDGGDARAQVQSLHLGGLIFFSEEIPAGTEALGELVRSAVPKGRSTPVVLSVDQEGGIVERVKGEATRFPGFMSAGAAGAPAVTEAAYAASGAELAGLGFNLDFAPVADVTTGPEDPTIGSRSAGSDPEVVAEQMTAAVRGFQASGIAPVVKHFPGHGSVPADSHETLPVQERSLGRLRRTDWVPFERGIADGVPAIMVAHIDVRALDPGVPSSLSSQVITGQLRGALGFDGLVVTDALDMAGVTATHGSASSAVAAMLAGADVLLMPPDPAAARAGLVAAVEEKRLARKRLEQAAARQVALLLHHENARGGAAPGSGEAASYRLSRAAVTLASGPCRGGLVGRSVSVSGDEEAVAAFKAAARRMGLRTGGGRSVALLGYGDGPATADIVVATDTPYVLGSSTAPVKIATYGDTPGAMRALVEVLLGERRARGRLPVPVEGVDRTTCAAPR